MTIGEATKAFGNDAVFLEKYIEEPHHIEFQVVADKHGNVIHLGERDCSLQRRHQKLVEIAPSLILDEKLRAAMGETAVKVAQIGGLRQRGHRRVPGGQEQELLLPGDEHPHPGGAYHHRGGHRASTWSRP